MLSTKLLVHGWKSALRSASRGESIAGSVILFLVIAAVGLELLGLGIFLPRLLAQSVPGSDPVDIVNGFLIYFLLTDLLLRFVLQRIPSQLLGPYLHLPIKKSVLIHLLLTRSLVSFFNVLPLLLVVPFGVTGITPHHGRGSAVAWIEMFAVLMVSNSFLNFFLKKEIVAKPRIVFAVGVLLLLTVVLDRTDVVSVTQTSKFFFGIAIEHPTAVLVLVPLPLILYLLNYRLLRSHSYIEELQYVKKQGIGATRGFRFVESWGDVGLLLSLDLKLMLRNKRSKGSLYLGLSGIAVGVLLYSMLEKTDSRDYPQPIEQSITTTLSPHGESFPAPNQKRVVLSIRGRGIPSFAHVYVTGNHSLLGSWKPRLVPLRRQPDSSWSGTFYFDKGTEIQYRFTLGSWRTEELLPGKDVPPPNYSLIVQGDTTIVRDANCWRVPQRDTVLEVYLIYVGLMVSGLLMLVYGQFLLAWGSSYFDGLLTWRMSIESLLRAKYLMLILLGVISYLLSLPFIAFGLEVFFINSVLCLYNLGVNSIILIALAVFHQKRLDVNEGIFSQQGKGASQFLAVLPLYVLPILLYIPVKALGLPGGLYVLFGGLGALGLVAHRPLLRWATKMIVNRRYEIAAGFRQR